jgi:hypothetical protein
VGSPKPPLITLVTSFGTPQAMVVEMGHVLGEHRFEVAAVEDQYPVEQFSADGTDPSFGDRVGPRRQLHLIPTIGIAVCG